MFFFLGRLLEFVFANISIFLGNDYTLVSNSNNASKSSNNERYVIHPFKSIFSGCHPDDSNHLRMCSSCVQGFISFIKKFFFHRYEKPHKSGREFKNAEKRV